MAMPATGPIGPPPVTGKLPIGTIINNNYRITDVLKAGGMGEVYRGIEIGTGDPVAVKAILPELAADLKAGMLFQREARTLRQLSDESIVRYYNYVHDPGLNRYFLIMEFVEGVTLSDHLAKWGAVPTAACCTLLDRLAKGLSRAHAQDVIHRDLSPDNVMLPDGLMAEARLIDFGIAKSNVVKEGTMAGQFAGKFKYVSPEQLGHFHGVIAPQTDVYGLALLICAAVTGKPLNMGTSIVEAVQSRQSIPDLSAVPDDLRPLLSYMLEPDPAARPQSMQDVRRLLAEPETIPARYLDGLPTPAPYQGSMRETTKTQGALPHVAVPGLQRPSVQTIVTQAATLRQPVPTVTTAPVKTSGRGYLLAAGLVAAVLASGYWAYEQGALDTLAPMSEQATPGAAAGGFGPVLADTRDGFLAGYAPAPCTLVSRVTAGANAGVIEGFSVNGRMFAELSGAYAAAFGTQADVVARQITEPQCAALDFVRALQGRNSDPVQVLLSQDRVQSGEALDAVISLPANDPALWLVLISPLGAVYNLTGRLGPQVAGQRSLSVGLTLREGAAAAPQLLLALSTDEPSVRAALADGAQAAEVLPVLLDELTARGGRGSAALAWVLLTQPDPAPPEPEPDQD
ncbi:MAG: serine/threonine protein kinase [Loktanella sp.]|nr:serine/threonine protein kinase [Loktanella sp.]